MRIVKCQRLKEKAGKREKSITVQKIQLKVIFHALPLPPVSPSPPRSAN